MPSSTDESESVALLPDQVQADTAPDAFEQAVAATPEQNAAASAKEESAGFRVTRDLALLWTSQFVSSLGDWCLWIAIPITIYNATNSRKDLAFTLLTESLPYLIFSPLAGAIVDRTNRRMTMIASDITRAVLVALLALPLVHPIPIWEYYAVLFCASAASAFFLPARTVVMRQVVPQRQLMRVNALISTSTQLSEVFGPALGGFALAILTRRGAFLADTLTFLFSAACAAGLTIKAIPPAREVKLTAASIGHDIADGARLIWHSPILRGLLLVWTVTYAASALFTTMLYAVGRDVLHLAPQRYGLMMSFIGIGYLSGGILITTALHKQKPIQLLPIGLALETVAALTTAFSHDLAFGCAAMFLFGFATMLLNAPSGTLIQTLVERDMLGRFSSAFSVVGRLAQIVGSAGAALLAASSLGGVYMLSAFCFFASAVLASLLLPKATPTSAAAS